MSKPLVRKSAYLHSILTIIFFSEQILLEKKQNYIIRPYRRKFVNKNLIKIWLLQIGEQFINKEIAMKCLQSLKKFLTLKKNAPTEKKTFQ